MSDLEKLRQWLSAYPGFDIAGEFLVDYTDRIPASAGLFPAGLKEIGRSTDILGNVTVRNQYNFSIYTVLEKSPGDNITAVGNAERVMNFQSWVREQSAMGLAPVFGDPECGKEIIRAEDGAVYSASEEGLAVYVIRISVLFGRRYEVREDSL